MTAAMIGALVEKRSLDWETRVIDVFPPAQQEQVRMQLETVDVPVYGYQGMGKDLGSACGKPFSVAALAIIEPGDSEIMALQREIRGVVA